MGDKENIVKIRHSLESYFEVEVLKLDSIISDYENKIGSLGKVLRNLIIFSILGIITLYFLLVFSFIKFANAEYVLDNWTSAIVIMTFQVILSLLGYYTLSKVNGTYNQTRNALLISSSELKQRKEDLMLRLARELDNDYR